MDHTYSEKGFPGYKQEDNCTMPCGSDSNSVMCFSNNHLPDIQEHGFADGVTVKHENEDNFECAYELSTDSAELKKETPEFKVDVIYEDIKPNICEDQWSSTSIGSGAGQSNTAGEINETNLEKDDTRDETTITVGSMIPSKNPHHHKYYSKNFSCKSEQDHINGPYQCQICLRVFKDKMYLKLHEDPCRRKIHGEGKPLHFKEKLYLKLQENPCRRKIRGEGIPKPFRCKFCSQRFATSSGLWKHKKTHANEIGSKSFDSNIIIQHQKMHTGEKAFQCEICSTSFALKDALTQHQKLHSEGKLTQCNFCLKTYLVDHEIIHTGDKPYRCISCLKKSTLKIIQQKSDIVVNNVACRFVRNKIERVRTEEKVVSGK